MKPSRVCTECLTGQNWLFSISTEPQILTTGLLPATLFVVFTLALLVNAIQWNHEHGYLLDIKKGGGSHTTFPHQTPRLDAPQKAQTPHK